MASLVAKYSRLIFRRLGGEAPVAQVQLFVSVLAMLGMLLAAAVRERGETVAALNSLNW